MPHTFTDAAGRTWTVPITIGAVARLKASPLGVDLLRLHERVPAAGEYAALPEKERPTLADVLDLDWPVTAHVLWSLVEGQARAANIAQEMFCDALDGEAFFAAKDAFWGALTDFFRSLRRLEQVEAIVKLRALREATLARMTAEIETLDAADLSAKLMAAGPSLQTRIEAGIATLGSTSGAPPATSASIPVP